MDVQSLILGMFVAFLPFGFGMLVGFALRLLRVAGD